MAARHVAVVTGKDHQRVLADAAAVERIQEALHLMINHRHLGVVDAQEFADTGLAKPLRARPAHAGPMMVATVGETRRQLDGRWIELPVVGIGNHIGIMRIVE